MKISTGASEDHPTPLPVDTTHTPALAPPVQVASAPGAQQGPVFIDTSGVLAQDTAAAQTAMQESMQATATLRQHYQASMLPVAASYGDDMQLPPVQDQNVTALPPLYVQGDQPGA